MVAVTCCFTTGTDPVRSTYKADLLEASACAHINDGQQMGSRLKLLLQVSPGWMAEAPGWLVKASPLCKQHQG